MRKMARILKVIIIILMVYVYMVAPNTSLAVTSSFDVNMNLNMGDLFHGHFDSDSKLQGEINGKMKSEYGTPKQTYKLGVNKFSYNATVKVSVWYDSMAYHYKCTVSVNEKGQTFDVTYNSFNSKNTYTNEVTEINSEVKKRVEGCGITSYPEKITAEELPEKKDYSKRHWEPDYTCKVNAIVTLTSPNNTTCRVSAEVGENVDLNSVPDNKEGEYSQSTGNLEKIQDYNNEVRYIVPEGAKSYNYTSNNMEWTGQTIGGGTMVRIKAKYKDKNGTQWVELENGKYVEASKLTIDAPEPGTTGATSGNSNGGGSSVPNTQFGSSGVNMTGGGGTDIPDPTQDANVYNPGDINDASELITKAGVIVGIIRNIGVVIGVIGLLSIGIRYIFASITEKAEYKETVMPYVLGCVLLMAGTIVIDFIYSVAVTLGK